jgi:putative membrane protein
MAILRGIVVGLVAGVVGAAAMSVVHKGLTAINSGTRPPTAAADQEQGEDATVKVADGITRSLLHRPLPEDKKPLAGHIVHYAFGAGVGGLYGGLATVMPRVTIARGLPFGAAVWVGAHVIMVPALGLAAPPTRQPLPKEALEFVLHLVYGAVTELGRRLIRQRR